MRVKKCMHAVQQGAAAHHHTNPTNSNVMLNPRASVAAYNIPRSGRTSTSGCAYLQKFAARGAARRQQRLQRPTPDHSATAARCQVLQQTPAHPAALLGKEVREGGSRGGAGRLSSSAACCCGCSDKAEQELGSSRCNLLVALPASWGTIKQHVGNMLH